MEFPMDLDEPGAYSDDERVDRHDEYMTSGAGQYAESMAEYEVARDKMLRSRQEQREDETDKGDGKQVVDVGPSIQKQEDTPPENFSPVAGQIYRSSFPRPENFSFLAKLKLKSILVLIPEEYPAENETFARENGINVFRVGMSGNKEPFAHVPQHVMTQALEVAINPANHPLLIHCNRGKHRTGCLVGCIRRLQHWSLTMIFDEYRRFAAPKARALDQQFIEMYSDGKVVDSATEKGWLPIQW